MSGFYTNLGAQRLRERGMFPYGDPLLTNTPGATYSPILYYSHLIYQVLLAPIPLNPPDPRPAVRRLCAAAGARQQAATITFHLVGVGALFVAARRMMGSAGGVGRRGALLRQRLRDGRRRRAGNDRRHDVRLAHRARGGDDGGVCGADAPGVVGRAAGDRHGDALLAGVPVPGVAGLLLAVEAGRAKVRDRLRAGEPGDRRAGVAALAEDRRPRHDQHHPARDAGTPAGSQCLRIESVWLLGVSRRRPGRAARSDHRRASRIPLRHS